MIHCGHQCPSTPLQNADKGTNTMSLAINQYWSNSKFPISNDRDDLYHTRPRLGLVIGTFAAVPYIHLQLEARRRLYPDVPTLVHDDGSPVRDDLLSLCAQYGVDFESNSQRLPYANHLGDLSTFLGGLQWAKSKGIELLLKLSRRWLPLSDWTDDLITLAMESQNATFSNHTISYGFGFRTECLGMAVSRWATDRVFESIIARMVTGEDVFVEGYIHQFAMEFDLANCMTAQLWNERHPLPPDRRGYAPWAWMGTDRCYASPSAGYLWHNSHPPTMYAQQAQTWGLPYTNADFEDPNQRFGLGRPNSNDPFSKPSAWAGLETKYQRLINGLSPVKTIVEIGVDCGWSMFHFARDFPEAAVFGIDSYIAGPDPKSFVLSHIKKFPNADLIVKSSAEAAAEFDKSIDLLHIDADHSYEAVKADFEMWSPKVRNGGCVLFHDVESFDGVRRFFQELPGYKCQVTEHHGLGCWHKP